MDIKDWILIGGGLLLVAVIGHGFWLAWRGKRETLKMDIDPNIPPDDKGFDPTFGELGQVRVIKREPVEQRDLDLGAADVAPRSSQAREPIVSDRKKTMPREPKVAKPTNASKRAQERTRLAPEPERVQEPRVRVNAEPPAPRAESPAPRPPPTPREVIVINVLARNGAQFGGSDLVEAFLRNGLKFGDMNIFHRIQPASKVVQFSVASAVEPGTFDLSAMESFKTPGVSFFMQMPGPDEPLGVFEDMLAVTRDVAASLGADLKDEHQSVMTTQTIAHCRARIEDFSRKRMSQRAS
jgi:cell division protein ZipA